MGKAWPMITPYGQIDRFTDVEVENVVSHAGEVVWFFLCPANGTIMLRSAFMLYLARGGEHFGVDRRT